MYIFINKQMTSNKILFILLLPYIISSQAPFIPLDTTHQAYSQFEINLILNENRNYPIILTTVSTNLSKNAVIDTLKSVHELQKYSAFSIIVDCNQFRKNLNSTLRMCLNFQEDTRKRGEQQGVDNYFSCQFFIPSQLKIKQKGHTIMKNHNQQTLPDGKYFTVQYIAQLIKKNIPDFVHYLEDESQLKQFLQQESNLKVSKLPKLLYFDSNLLSPVFIRKLSAVMNGKIQVAVTDDPPIAKKYQVAFDSLLFLEYSFDHHKYQYRTIPFDQYQSPEESILADQRISKYMKVKKNRDILLDFQHLNYAIYDFTERHEIQYLLTHGRPIILQILSNTNNYACSKLKAIAQKYNLLFNYVCYNSTSIKQFSKTGYKSQNQLYFIVYSVNNGVWVNDQDPILQHLPRNISRQRVSTETQADYCLKTAMTSQRDPIFFYFNQKTHGDSILIMNYLNSLPEVTSLLYFCQIYLPDEELIDKFQLKQNTMFVLMRPDKHGNTRKLQHSQVDNFLQIKMFLRQIAIEKMLRVYDERLLHNNVEKIDTAQQLTEKCFNKKCVVGLIATGRYREQQQMKMLKQLKLQYEQIFTFVWVDGICHWDVPRQLKLLKKKQKIIDRSYAFFYNEKDITYNLWDGKKFWEKKELQKWIKSLKSARILNHLKFAIDIQDRICDKKNVKEKVPQEL